jgi:hypothetical protein
MRVKTGLRLCAEREGAGLAGQRCRNRVRRSLTRTLKLTKLNASRYCRRSAGFNSRAGRVRGLRASGQNQWTVLSSRSAKVQISTR